MIVGRGVGGRSVGVEVDDGRGAGPGDFPGFDKLAHIGARSDSSVHCDQGYQGRESRHALSHRGPPYLIWLRNEQAAPRTHALPTEK